MQIIVNDLVADRVQHSARTALQQDVAGLEPLADVGQRTALAVPHRYNEILTQEESYLAGLDKLGAVDVTHRLQYDEDGVAVDVDLRALVRFERVFHRERM